MNDINKKTCLVWTLLNAQGDSIKDALAVLMEGSENIIPLVVGDNPILAANSCKTHRPNSVLIHQELMEKHLNSVVFFLKNIGMNKSLRPKIWLINIDTTLKKITPLYQVLADNKQKLNSEDL